MLEQQKASRTIFGDIACYRFDIIRLEHLEQVTCDGAQLLRFLTAQITQFHGSEVAACIFREHEQINHPDDALITRSAQFPQNLTRESIALKSDAQCSYWPHT